jgi:hypothetical protein
MRARSPIVAVLAVLAMAAHATAAQGSWRMEPVPSPGAVGLLDLAFDTTGRGLLSWEGFDQQGRRPFTAVGLRVTAGAWQRAPDLADLTWGGAQIHLYAGTRALMVGSAMPSPSRVRGARLVYARGISDGRFQPPRMLAEDVVGHVSAVNDAGDALIAYSDRGTGRTYVIERTAGRAFGRARPLRPGGVGAVAINAAGDRVLAWWGRDGVYARVRRAAGRWGRAVRVVRAAPVADAPVRAVMTRGGRAVLAWYTAAAVEDAPVDVATGVAVRARSAWRSFTLERSRVTSSPFVLGTAAIPVVNSAQRVYVTWTGVLRGVPVVKLARITMNGPRGRMGLSSAAGGAAVDDAAAGPNRSIAVSWSAIQNDSSIATYASLRRRGSSFTAPERLTPEGVTGLAGSRIAFQPLTGEAVVAWAYVTSDGTGAVQASVSPPG